MSDRQETRRRGRTVEVDREATDSRRMVETCRILVTNDDGIGSPGLQRLAQKLHETYEVVVAAPAGDVSGSGTGIGRYDAADPTALKRVDFDGIEAYSLDGPPGLAVMAGALGAFGPPPDLVVAGVNAGINTGTSIIHSGTVGAARTARTFGRSGIAVSLAKADRWYWETAVSYAAKAVGWVIERPGLTTLNVNVPGRPPDEVRGVRWASIDEFGHFHVAAADTAGGELLLHVRDRRSGSDPDSDTAICLGGEVALTMLSPLGADDPPDAPAEMVVGTLGSRELD